MYTAVLMAALTTTTAGPGFGRGWHSCACYGGYPYAFNPGCYCAPYGGYGFAGGGYGYHGGCYGGYGMGAAPYGYGGIPYGVGCYGCYGGYSCYGMPVPAFQAPVPQRSTAAPTARDLYPPINPDAGKDGTEVVPAPPEKKPITPKKTSNDPNAPARAKVIIEIPQGGKLFVDDRPISAAAGKRTFQTPPLAPGERYFYDIRIEHDGQAYRQRVIIEAGQAVAVSAPIARPTTVQR